MAAATGRAIRVRGMVQGVGFRPTVWRLARRCGVGGDVRNDGEGVLIHAWGSAADLDDFTALLSAEPPPLARVDAVLVTALTDRGAAARPRDFSIVASGSGAVHTAVVPDAATCADCLAEIRDPADRRHGHAFANCTHCGPRLSIVEGVPYDRAGTTMRAFAMCAVCRREYDDPADRRFHAQPTCCPACGPHLWLEDADGRHLADDPAGALSGARAALLSGHIVAVKGVGGFHLACDALDGRAVDRLRARKRRDAKPLALMARDLGVVRRHAAVSAEAAALLSGAAAPIVILPARGCEPVAAAVAPGVKSLGFMLPHTPLHHLLLQGIERPIVMTSGNVSDEPPCTDNDEARRRLVGIGDVFLLHDRGIANRVDDSVMRSIADAPRMLRRGRGHAPAPLALPPGFERAPELLAMGGELKNTFCLVKDGQAVLSQHIGDLESAPAHADYRRNLALYGATFAHRPVAIAVDLHPEYLSTKLGRAQAESGDLRLEPVQHHHAHVAACLAENGRPLAARPVLGIALDGLGLGDDGSLWGGEFLLADYRGYVRLGRFRPVPLLGGAQAVREPWRSTYAHLCAAVGWPAFVVEHAGSPLHVDLAARPLAGLDSMLAAGVNSPPASSCGRLFDAVAATLGVCRDRVAYEGQAAIELEALAEEATLEVSDAGYPFADGAPDLQGLVEVDPAPMWRALLADLTAKAAASTIAARFHRGLAIAVVRMACRLAAGAAPAARFDTVALSGGVFQNALLFEAVQAGLQAAGFQVLAHSKVPNHDGGLALGQAAVAAARAIDRLASIAGKRRANEEFACA